MGQTRSAVELLKGGAIRTWATRRKQNWEVPTWKSWAAWPNAAWICQEAANGFQGSSKAQRTWENSSPWDIWFLNSVSSAFPPVLGVSRAGPQGPRASRYSSWQAYLFSAGFNTSFHQCSFFLSWFSAIVMSKGYNYELHSEFPVSAQVCFSKVILRCSLYLTVGHERDIYKCVFNYKWSSWNAIKIASLWNYAPLQRCVPYIALLRHAVRCWNPHLKMLSYEAVRKVACFIMFSCLNMTSTLAKPLNRRISEVRFKWLVLINQ